MENNTTEAKKPGVMIYFEIRPQLKLLKPMQRLAIYDAILDYAEQGTEPALKQDAARLAWGFIKPILDRDDARYQRTVDARRKGGLVRGKQIAEAAIARRQQNEESSLSLAEATFAAPQLSSDSQSTIFNPQSTIDNLQSTNINLQSSDGNLHLPISIPREGEKKNTPSLDEVKEFVSMNGLAVNPQDFWEYYSARGWILRGEPIREWEVLAIRWDRNEHQKQEEETSYGGVDLSEFGVQR